MVEKGNSVANSCCCSKPEIRKAVPFWQLKDYYGAVMCRVSDGFRNKYRVKPGLYTFGSPSAESDVFVTANYKLSFDLLRKDLAGIDAWILVLDTDGINVWCAAGKGTFGTKELVRKIESEKLNEKVSHKRILVPQLGASGISAHDVKKSTGFSVVYGPVLSKDIKDFIANNYASTSRMRTVTFTIAERAVLIPIEVVAMVKKAWLIVLLVAMALGIQKQGIMFGPMIHRTMPLFVGFICAIFAGSVLHPIILPLSPVRSFALQGLFLGLLCDGVLHGSGLFSGMSIYGTGSAYLLVAALSSYLAFNFTGCTPIANKSGVKKELRIAFPMYVASAVAVTILIVLYKLSCEAVI